jgi:hypothetical protein
MTAQMFDIVIFEGESYRLSSSTNELPFKVEAFNIEPVWSSTSCWRGFLRTFIIEEKKLFIKQLDVNDKKIRNSGLSEYRPNIIYGKYPEINYPPDIDNLFEMTYKELNHKIDFTGLILIGKTFYLGLLDHIGNNKWQHNETYELTFNNGVLVAYKDMAESLNEIGAMVNKLNIKIGTRQFYQWLKNTTLKKYYKENT